MVGVETLKGIGGLNGAWTIVALNRCVPLHTISLANGMNSK